ncbi:hypothetical protein COO60DRAFT_1464711 [Scenedesmus sp. NREL 46B-D3]|nr:hypothetical protein COO60DRAFT_1464711 [Scenedesmus sp. NREL 46B-D3]
MESVLEAGVQLTHCIVVLKAAAKKRKTAHREPAGATSALGRSNRVAAEQPLPLYLKITNFSFVWIAAVMKLNKKAVEGSSSFLNDPSSTQNVGDLLLASKASSGQFREAVAIVLYGQRDDPSKLLAALQVQCCRLTGLQILCKIIDEDQAVYKANHYLVTRQGYALVPDKDGNGGSLVFTGSMGHRLMSDGSPADHMTHILVRSPEAYAFIEKPSGNAQPAPAAVQPVVSLEESPSLAMPMLVKTGANPVPIVYGLAGCGKTAAARFGAMGTGMLKSQIQTGKTSDEKLLDLASVQKGGMVIMDNGTNSMGTHTKGGLFKTFIEQLSSSTISRGQRCPEAMLALYTNEQPGVIKDEAVLTHVTAIRMPQAYAVSVKHELRDRGSEYLNRVLVNISSVTTCAVALARTTMGNEVAAQLQSYCLNIWAQQCQELLDSLTPFAAVTCALQAMLESTVTVEASGERQQLARIVAAGGRFMMLAIKGPGRKAFLVAYPAMAEAYETATGHEFPLNKAEAAQLFKTSPGLGLFSYQAQTHVFAAPPNAEGADAVFAPISGQRTSVMAFWADKLPPKLVAALEAARPSPPGLFKDEAALGSDLDADDGDEELLGETPRAQQPAAAGPSKRDERVDALLRPGCPATGFLDGAGTAGAVMGAGASTSAAEAAIQASYSQGRVSLGQGCDIVLRGWMAMGHVCEMVVGLAFLPDKSAAAKEVLFECLFAAQAAVPDAVYTRFVGSDSPHSDLSMLRAVQARVLPHAPRLDAGDDLWHVMDRTMSHRRPAAYGEVQLLLVLLAVLALLLVMVWLKAMVWLLLVLSRGVRSVLWTAVVLSMLLVLLAVLVLLLLSPYMVSFEVRVWLLLVLSRLLVLAVLVTRHLCHGHQGASSLMSRVPRDKTAALLKHLVYLVISKAAAQAAKNAKLPEAVRHLCGGLFLRAPGIPFEAVAARLGVPYIITFERPQRVYTMVDFQAQFDQHGGLVL